MLLTLIYILTPILLIILCQRFSLLEKLGVVVLSFGCGIAIASSIDLSQIFSAETIKSVQGNVTEISIALALPLLVFSMNVKSAFSMAGDTLKGMMLALFSVIFVSIIGALVFNDDLVSIWQIAGMSVGAYTGGGPNMAAIKTAIGGDESIFITMVSYDIIFSGLYLIFVMSIGQRLFGLFLRPYAHKTDELSEENSSHMSQMDHMADETAKGYNKLVERGKLAQTVLALLCSGLVVGLSLVIASLVPEDMKSTVTIVSITSLGLFCSFIPQIRKLANSFQLGMYLILVFCFTAGSMTDVQILMNLDYSLAAYISFVLIGSLMLQAILCKFSKIDTDTFLITSSAAILSVPFIPAISGALKNRDILLPGFAAAIIGYALGNYLGIIVAHISKWLVGA